MNTPTSSTAMGPLRARLAALQAGWAQREARGQPRAVAGVGVEDVVGSEPGCVGRAAKQQLRAEALGVTQVCGALGTGHQVR